MDFLRGVMNPGWAWSAAWPAVLLFLVAIPLPVPPLLFLYFSFPSLLPGLSY